MMTTVDEVNSNRTKVPAEFICPSVLLDCFTAEVDVTFDVSLYLSFFNNKIRRLLTSMRTNNRVPVFMF